MNPQRSIVRLQPHSVAEAVRLMSDYQGYPLVLAGRGIPPLAETNQAIFLDTGRLDSLSGIAQLGGVLTIGLNTTYDEVIASSLIQAGAACLIDAAHEGSKVALGGAFAFDLQRPLAAFPTIAALLALETEVELAYMESGGQPVSAWQPLTDYLSSPPPNPHLLMRLRLTLPPKPCGTALVLSRLPGGTDSPVQALAVTLALSGVDGRLVDVTVTIAERGVLPYALTATAHALVGAKITQERIEQAVQIALTEVSVEDAQPQPFAINLTPHLLRQALDKAAARAQHGHAPPIERA